MPGVTPTFGALRTASAALALASLLKNSVPAFAFMSHFGFSGFGLSVLRFWTQIARRVQAPYTVVQVSLLRNPHWPTAAIVIALKNPCIAFKVGT